MLKNHSVIEPAGVLKMTADYTGPQKSNSKISYNAGTVYAKQKFTVAKGGGLDFTASFIVPTVKGTWPAFWLTSATTWPPEIDIAEWKGDGKISFNTFNTSSQVQAHDVSYLNPGQWHTVKAELRDEDGTNVKTTFFLDGKEQTAQVGKGYTGKAFWLIIDFQMLGSSGSTGPKTESTYEVKNMTVLEYSASTGC